MRSQAVSTRDMRSVAAAFGARAARGARAGAAGDADAVVDGEADAVVELLIRVGLVLPRDVAR